MAKMQGADKTVLTIESTSNVELYDKPAYTVQAADALKIFFDQALVVHKN